MNRTAARSVTVIPPTINPLTHLSKVTIQKRRVAGYARVSTDSDEQFTSYEAQVDFGQFKMKDMYDRNIRVYFFCMVLSYSRMRFVYFSREPFCTKTAVDAHKYAFRYFGGRTQTILYDQDRLFVISEKYGNIILVPEFEDFVRKAGFSVVLCHKSDPQTKGKVELRPLCKRRLFAGQAVYRYRFLEQRGTGVAG